MFTVERVTERLFPVFWKSKIDPWFTPVWRRRILIIGAIIVFVYANFRAFDDVTRKAFDLQTTNNELTKTVNDRSQKQAKQEREAERRKRSIDAIVQLISKGTDIHATFSRDRDTKLLINEYNSWVFSAEFTLENMLGPTYATQFNSAPVAIFTLAGQDPASTGTWQAERQVRRPAGDAA